MRVLESNVEWVNNVYGVCTEESVDILLLYVGATRGVFSCR